MATMSDDERHKLYEDSIRRRAQQAENREEEERQVRKADYIARVNAAIKSGRLAEFLWEIEERLNHQSSDEPKIG